MALVSKSKAAKLAGVSRTTIHRYVNDGKLSMTGDMVDTSELMRVFGSLHAGTSEQSSTGVQVNTSEHDVTPEVQGVLHRQISMLESQVNDLRTERDNWRQKSDELVELLRNEQENTKLLTHQSPATGKNDSLALLVVAGFTVFVVVVVLVYWQSQF
jgi:hypothetical protein